MFKFILISAVSIFSLTAFATEDYTKDVVLDISAQGSGLVNGYRAILRFNYFDPDHSEISTVEYWHNIPAGKMSPDSSLNRWNPNGGKPFVMYLSESVDDFKKGMDLIQIGGKTYLQLEAPNLDARSGGEIMLNFARNAFRGDDRQMVVEMVRNPDNHQFIFQQNANSGRNYFDYLGINIGTELLVPYGVDSIGFSYQGTTFDTVIATDLPRVKITE